MVAFSHNGYLTINQQFSAPIYGIALELDPPAESPLRGAWKEFVRLATATPVRIHSCRALIQNAARSIVFVALAYEGGKIEEAAFRELSEGLER